MVLTSKGDFLKIRIYTALHYFRFKLYATFVNKENESEIKTGCIQDAEKINTLYSYHDFYVPAWQGKIYSLLLVAETDEDIEDGIDYSTAFGEIYLVHGDNSDSRFPFELLVSGYISKFQNLSFPRNGIKKFNEVEYSPAYIETTFNDDSFVNIKFNPNLRSIVEMLTIDFLITPATIATSSLFFDIEFLTAIYGVGVVSQFKQCFMWEHGTLVGTEIAIRAHFFSNQDNSLGVTTQVDSSHIIHVYFPIPKITLLSYANQNNDSIKIRMSEYTAIDGFKGINDTGNFVGDAVKLFYKTKLYPQSASQEVIPT